MTKTGTLRVVNRIEKTWTDAGLRACVPWRWTIALPGGEKIQRTLPLGAAVELEKRGVEITAISPSDWEV